MTVKKKLIALSFIAGLTATLLAAPANASESFELPQTLKVAPLASEAVTAKSAAKLNYERPSVSTTKAAPVVEAPVEAVQPTKSEAASTASESTRTVVTQPVAVPVAQASVQNASASVAAPAATPVSGNAVVNAARAQVGVTQDCTALVTKSLAAVGIKHHGWPASYLTLGRVVSVGEALPGDLLYYANGGGGVAHIGVYIGGGRAIHGGWNGNQTVEFSANVGSGPVYIRVGG